MTSEVSIPVDSYASLNSLIQNKSLFWVHLSPAMVITHSLEIVTDTAVAQGLIPLAGGRSGTTAYLSYVAQSSYSFELF